MERMVRVNFRNRVLKEYPAGTKFKEIAADFKEYFNYKILIAKVDNELTPLEAELTKKCDIDFYDRSSTTGNAIYTRSLQFVLVLAVKRLLGKAAKVLIEHSIDKGVYIEIDNVEEGSINKNTVKEIGKVMDEIIKEDLIFTKVNVLRKDAIKYFKSEHQEDKVRVFKYISNR